MKGRWGCSFSFWICGWELGTVGLRAWLLEKKCVSVGWITVLDWSVDLCSRLF